MTSDSGLAVIRSALLARAKKGHFTPLARDHGLGTATLEEFAHGRAKLPNDILRVSSKIPALNRATNAATASINLTFVKVSGNASAQKHQHPRQIEFIILSIFASSGGPRHLRKALCPTSWCRARQRWCRRRRPSWTYETIPCHALLPCRRGQTPRWLKGHRKGRCKERKAFSCRDSSLAPAGGGV